MATLLDGVNEVLKRVGKIAGESGELLTLTDVARQRYVDTAVQIWNELVEQLYSESDLPMPKELAEDTITLVTDDRDYDLASDLVQLHWPLLDETNGQYITAYPGGYMQMVIDQPFPANETGLAMFAAIRPTDGQLYLDKIPTANENSRVYKYRYDKDVSLSEASDTFPFSDQVFRAMVPAVSEVWSKRHNNTFNESHFNSSMGRAARFLTKVQQRTSWNPRTVPALNVTDPFNANK